MRNFLTIFIVVSFIIFTLVIIPAALNGFSLQTGKDENGKVLGVSEASADAFREEIMSGLASLPESQNKESTTSTTTEPEKPTKKADFKDINDLDCASVVMDAQSGEVLFENRSDSPAPIASITKLATALTFLDFHIDLDSSIEILPSDIVTGGKIYVKPGEKLKIGDLLHLSLIGSGNSETKALSRSSGLSQDEFIGKMNEKMKSLGLTNTSFADPIGISEKNVSTAKEIAELAHIAFENEKIESIVSLKSYSLTTEGGRKISVYSTDSLLTKYPDGDIKIIGGKTGFTNSAGYCFVGGFENEKGRRLISVVLGEDDYNSRFRETEKLISWAYANYEWE
jgi:D-alanyl-D-alanine carboxypeptidase